MLLILGLGLEVASLQLPNSSRAHAASAADKDPYEGVDPNIQERLAPYIIEPKIDDETKLTPRKEHSDEKSQRRSKQKKTAPLEEQHWH